MEQTETTGGLSAGRLLALADGIFAIAMTLLVFELKVPEGAAAHLGQSLLALWPKFGAVLLGFITLGFSWIGHHNQYLAIIRTDRPFLWINIAFLGSISFMPFSSALLGSYPFDPIAIWTYGLNMVVAGLVLYAHWSYATAGGRLVRTDTHADLVKSTKLRVMRAPLGYLVGSALCLVSPIASLVVFAAIPISFILPGRVDKHWTAPS
jgi:uncharacterized membrane protein